MNVNREPLRITEHDRVKILQYMLIHSLRVPQKMGWMKRYVEEHHPRINQITTSDARNLQVQGLGRTYNLMVENWVRILDSRELSIESFPVGSKMSVFTCDNPVIIFDPQEAFDGIAYDTTHVLFPVERRAFIRWAGRDDRRDMIRVEVHRDRKSIDEFNRKVVKNATDEIYTANPHQLYCLRRKMGLNPILKLPACRR